MDTNIEFYDIQRTRECEDTSIESDSYIYKADYNFLVGIVWREAIQHAQQLGKINQGQYGGCPGRDCTSVTYLEN